MHPFRFHPRSAALRIKCLTPRQYKVIYLLAEGLTYKQIALQMHISYGTVTSHVYSALERMHVMTVNQAVALMARAAIHQPPAGPARKK